MNIVAFWCVLLLVFGTAAIIIGSLLLSEPTEEERKRKQQAYYGVMSIAIGVLLLAIFIGIIVPNSAIEA